jgi:hypothetical protein
MMNKLAAALLALTAGCAADSDGTLHITGRLADPKTVTHVIATNPETGDRIVVDMKSDGLGDGEFNVAVPAGSAWIVTFADITKTGAAMQVATLQAGGLDAFASKAGGKLDFGTVNVTGGYAHGTLAWEDLTKATGYLALRYSNPDVDGDGEMDALQNHDYRIELDGQFHLMAGSRDITPVDLVSGYKAPSIRYLGTAIRSVVPRAMGMNMQSGTVTFQQPFYGTAYGDNTPMVQPGKRIGQPHVKFGELEGNPLLGVVAHPDRDAPSGSYQFAFDNGKLTFTNVIAPSADSLNTASDFSVPFVHIRPRTYPCVSNCDIGSVDLEWQRATESGWQTSDVRDARIDMLVMVNGKRAYVSANLADGETSAKWERMDLTGGGLLRSELAYVSTAEICYVAVSYTSELGMKMTNQAQNDACF